MTDIVAAAAPTADPVGAGAGAGRSAAGVTESVRRILAVTRHEMRILRRDPAPFIVLVFMPLLIVTFLKPAFASILAQEGYRFANGSEQAIPGITVMFSFFVVAIGGMMLYREHGWGTWDRLRASGARTGEVVVGKLLPLVLLLLVQFVLVFTAGWAFFGFRFRGSVLGAVLVWAGLAACLLALTAMMFALCRSDQQMVALVNVTTMLFGGLGGGLVPVASLPSWARHLSPATPSYWAISGFRSIALDHVGAGAQLRPTAVLLGFAAVFAVVCALRLRAGDRKGSRGY